MNDIRVQDLRPSDAGAIISTMSVSGRLASVRQTPIVTVLDLDGGRSITAFRDELVSIDSVTFERLMSDADRRPALLAASAEAAAHVLLQRAIAPKHRAETVGWNEVGAPWER